MLCDFRRKGALRQVVLNSEGWQGHVLRGSTEVFAFVYLDAMNPVLRVATTKAAFQIPFALDTMDFKLPEVALPVNGFLIIIDPPFRPMKIAVNILSSL